MALLLFAIKSLYRPIKPRAMTIFRWFPGGSCDNVGTSTPCNERLFIRLAIWRTTASKTGFSMNERRRYIHTPSCTGFVVVISIAKIILAHFWVGITPSRLEIVFQEMECCENYEWGLADCWHWIMIYSTIKIFSLRIILLLLWFYICDMLLEILYRLYFLFK